MIDHRTGSFSDFIAPAPCGIDELPPTEAAREFDVTNIRKRFKIKPLNGYSLRLDGFEVSFNSYFCLYFGVSLKYKEWGVDKMTRQLSMQRQRMIRRGEMLPPVPFPVDMKLIEDKIYQTWHALGRNSHFIRAMEYQFEHSPIQPSLLGQIKQSIHKREERLNRMYGFSPIERVIAAFDEIKFKNHLQRKNHLR